MTPRSAEIVEQAWSKVAPLTALDEDEAEYVDAIGQGELRLQWLFPDDDAVAVHLAQHPAILWKLSNVRSHKSRKARNRTTPAPDKRSNED